jgi:hypothetical protein
MAATAALAVEPEEARREAETLLQPHHPKEIMVAQILLLYEKVLEAAEQALLGALLVEERLVLEVLAQHQVLLELQ